MTGLPELGARLTAAAHLANPLEQARELVELQSTAAETIAAATDAAVTTAVNTATGETVAERAAAVADSLGVTSSAVFRRLTTHRRRTGQPGRPGGGPKRKGTREP